MVDKIIALVALVVWTLVCIYGTYDNTVKSASVTVVEGGYEVTYGNTGEIHFYTE